MKREGIIVGGGAAGLLAAITAAEAGASVTILEHMPRVGKKILSTGNGKCNMTNLHMTAECYRSGVEGVPMQVIDKFSVADTIAFFRRLGVLTTDRNGYVYPASGQAQTVLDALRDKADSLGIRTCCDSKVLSINKKKEGRFAVKTETQTYSADFVILCAGSMAAKTTGSDGSGYELAKSLGHKIKKPLPALVQLKCKGDFFKSIAGVRTDVKVSLYVMDKNGNCGAFLAQDQGELQLTDYGISGIPVFQVSRYAAEALDHKKRVLAVIDFMPDMPEDELFTVLKDQRNYLGDRAAGDFINGLFNKKLAALFLKAVHIRQEQPVSEIANKKLAELCRVIKEFSFEVVGTNPFDKAQICMGGVDLRDVNTETMESRLVPGLYFAGEILDVDGICGGYNLQWAWSSGHLSAVCATGRK
ncbi:MAG: NAD(P)/FAD-dependent oxidoreductase [Lachnoclostridium sp.]|nr:NAD(P)/FAD-dependent oxidoreductase [Lachnoclostridium sp.]